MSYPEYHLNIITSKGSDHYLPKTSPPKPTKTEKEKIRGQNVYNGREATHRDKDIYFGDSVK